MSPCLGSLCSRLCCDFVFIVLQTVFDVCVHRVTVLGCLCSSCGTLCLDVCVHCVTVLGCLCSSCGRLCLDVCVHCVTVLGCLCPLCNCVVMCVFIV